MGISDKEAESLLSLLKTALTYEPQESSQEELDKDDESLLRWENEGGPVPPTKTC